VLEEAVPLPSVRLVRFAKLTTLIAGVWTTFYAVLVVGWQITIFFKDGSWQALPLSFVFNASEYQREVYSTASIDKISGSLATNFIDLLLQMPIIIPLILAAVFLTTFYLWLSNIELQLTKM
jgi:hypothetical protein